MTLQGSCVLGILVVTLGCTRPAEVADSERSVASNRGCPAGMLWERDAAKGNTLDRLDLDCDGVHDTVKVELFDSAGVGFWRLTVVNRGSSIHLTAPWEGRPEPLGAVDLDADGLLDLLLVIADESGVVPWPVLVERKRLRTAPIAASPISYQYRFAEAPSDACVAAAIPRVIVDSTGLGLVKLTVNSGEPIGACPAAAVRALRWESDSLRVGSR